MAGYDLEEIRARLNILELIGRYMTLRPAGKNFKGRCPFHPDKNPSLVVSPEKGMWYCFGCQAGGDGIGFLMRMEKLSFPEALERLGQELGLEPSPRGGGAKARLLEVNAEAQRFFARELRSPAAKNARDFLRTRGLGEEAWDTYGLGYAPNSWDALLRALGRWGPDLLHQLGLVVQGERGYYDRFRDRVMFTIADEQGRPVAFAGRSLNGEPKYLNTPNTPLFTKGSVLYGLDRAKEALRTRKRAVLVEGYTDVISLHRAGVEEAVGSMGTALTKDQVGLLARFTEEVVIAYDRDAAGEASTLRGLLLLGAAHLRVKVAVLPPGEDPDSLVRSQGAHVAQEILAQTRPFHLFLAEALASRHDITTVEGKDQALMEIQAYWSEVGLPALKQELVRALAETLMLPEQEVSRVLEGRGRLVAVPQTDDRVQTEDLIVRFLVEGKFPPEVLGDLDPEAFRPEYRPIVRNWLQGWRQGHPPTVGELAAGLEPAAGAALARLALVDIAFSDEAKAMADAICKFVYRRKLDVRIHSVKKRLQEAEREGRSEEVHKLNEELQALCRERAALGRRR